MATIKLEFKTYKDDRPTACLYLDWYPSSKDGRVYLTADSKGISEFDGFVDYLIDQLKEVRTQARRKFKEAGNKKD